MFTRNRLFPRLALLSLLLASGCQLFEPKTSDADLDPISTQELKSFLTEEKPSIILLDVRTPQRYAQEHIDGSINIPIAQLRAADSRLASAKKIITISSGWSDYLAPAAAKKLIALNYKNIFDYRGGIEQWKNDGGKTTSSSIQPDSSPTP